MNKLQKADQHIFLAQKTTKDALKKSEILKALTEIYDYLSTASFINVLFNWRKVVSMLKEAVRLIIKFF